MRDSDTDPSPDLLEKGENNNKSIMQSVGEIISQSAQTVKEAVLAHIDHDNNSNNNNNNEPPDSETMPSSPGNQEEEAAAAAAKHEENQEDGDDAKGIVQSVGEMITQSAQSVKEVLANGHIPSVTESITEESGERPSMELVHTIVHD